MGDSLKNLRILLLEDDLLTLDVYKIFLGMEGANIRAASSTEEAFGILQNWMPDVIVSDIGLPGEDGYAFMTRIRAQTEFSNIYAIAITGYNDKARAREAGFQEVLAKPLDPADLLRAIQSYFLGGQPQQSA